MITQEEVGKIISFYSYKGGVGRTMAVANVGCLLAESAKLRDQSVLLIDWDLEAPGLHRFFSRSLEAESPGLIDYFCELYARLADEPDQPLTVDYLPVLDEFVIHSEIPGLDLMKAGRFDPEYPRRVAEFDWVGGLFDKSRGSIAAFRRVVAERYAWVLVDSRTGVSDTAGICTTLLPDKLVTMFAPNDQNLFGLSSVIPQILRYRRGSKDERPLTIFPVPSRCDWSDLPRQEDYLTRFRDVLTEIFKAEYELESCDLRRHFNLTMLPYNSYYSYGERIVVGRDEPDFPGSLRAAYQRLAESLLRDVPWQGQFDASGLA